MQKSKESNPPLRDTRYGEVMGDYGLRMTRAQANFATKIGDNNRSRGIRRLIDAAMESANSCIANDLQRIK